MFIENTISDTECGWIEVICGSMFSGKTEELLRRVRRAEIAGQRVQIYKPRKDSRYQTESVVSHDKSAIPAVPIDQIHEIFTLAKEAQVIAIDEAQFFDNAIISVVNQLANEGKRVIIAGLDMDYTGKPFGPMPYLMAIAEYVTKVHAICSRTGKLAHFSYRLTEESDQVVIGEKDRYEAVSRCVFNDLNSDEI